MRFYRRPLSFDYHADALCRQAELQVGREVQNIIINPTTAYESGEESDYEGTTHNNPNATAAASISDKTGSIDENPDYSTPVHSQNGDDDPCSAFPFMDECDDDDVSCRPLSRTCCQREICDLTALAPLALLITRKCLLDEKDVPFMFPRSNDLDYSGNFTQIIPIEQPVQSVSVNQLSMIPSMSETISTRALLVVKHPLHSHKTATALKDGMDAEPVDDFDDDDDDATGNVIIKPRTPPPTPYLHTTAASSTSEPLPSSNQHMVTFPPEEELTDSELMDDIDYGSDAIVETHIPDPCSKCPLALFRGPPDLITFGCKHLRPNKGSHSSTNGNHVGAVLVVNSVYPLESTVVPTLYRMSKPACIAFTVCTQTNAFLQRIYMAIYFQQINPRLSNEPCKDRHRIRWFAPSPQALWTRNKTLIHLMDHQPVGHVQSPVKKILLSDQVGFATLVTAKLPTSTALTIIPYKATIVVPDVVLEFVQAMLAFHHSRRIILARKIQRKRKRAQVLWSQHLNVAPSLNVLVAPVRTLSAAPCQTNTAKAGELYHTENRAQFAATYRHNYHADITTTTPLMVEHGRPAAECELPIPNNTQKNNLDRNEAGEQHTQTVEFELNLVDHSDSPPDSPLGCSYNHPCDRRQASQLSMEGIHYSDSILIVPPSAASSRASHFIEQVDMNLAAINEADSGIKNACYGRIRAADDSDDDRRAKKRAKKGKKKEKERKNMCKMGNSRRFEHTGIASAEEDRRARKRAKKEYRKQAKAGKKQKKANRKRSLCTLENLDPTKREDTIARSFHDESWKVTPEHSNQTKLSAHAASEDPPKKAGQSDGRLDPRIKKYFPKNSALRSSATKNQLDESHQETTPTRHHSPSGREINPPTSLSEVQLRSQSWQAVPYRAALVQLTPQPSKYARTTSPGLCNREDEPREMVPGIRPHHSFQPTTEVLPRSDTLPRARFSQSPSATTQVAPLVDPWPVTLLCSESFLGLWSKATAQLASGSWLSSWLPNPVDEVIACAPRPVGRKFLLQDTPLLDEIGVDIEIRGRGAIVVCSLASWAMLDIRAQVRKYVFTTAVGKYKTLDIYLCADIEITSSLASDIALLQNSLTCSDGDCVARFHTVSTKSLAAVLAHRLLSCGAQPLTCITDVVAKEKVERWVRFLLAFVPCLTITGALSLLQAAGEGDNSPLSEDGAMLGFQKLLGSKAFLEKCRDEIKVGRPSAHIDLATINQLAIVQLVSL
jgi:hypothetical protein